MKLISDRSHFEIKQLSNLRDQLEPNAKSMLTHKILDHVDSYRNDWISTIKIN